jgi:hypothetical protein
MKLAKKTLKPVEVAKLSQRCGLALDRASLRVQNDRQGEDELEDLNPDNYSTKELRMIQSFERGRIVRAIGLGEIPPYDAYDNIKDIEIYLRENRTRSEWEETLKDQFFRN